MTGNQNGERSWNFDNEHNACSNKGAKETLGDLLTFRLHDDELRQKRRTDVRSRIREALGVPSSLIIRGMIETLHLLPPTRRLSPAFIPRVFLNLYAECAFQFISNDP